MDLVGVSAALGRGCARRPWVTVTLATLVVCAPLFLALADLGTTTWYPVLDLAMTEFRVRDVFGAHTPLIGLPGRIGELPNQGSHPGPLSFYLLAPLYRLLGSTSWALEAATVAIHITAIATALWIGQRRAGWRGVLGVAAMLAVAIRGYGQLLLTQPWNPYLPVLAWLVVLLATWSVLCGDSLMLVPLVVAVLIGLPLIVAVVVLRSRPWHPVLDLAMTEFRVRDVFGRHTPLIGLPGRIGEYPNQGSHPGPLSFYLLAPTYRLLGASSWAMEAGTVAIHLLAIAAALWIGQRRLGWKGVAAVGAVVALVIHGYGQVTLTQPWNPYLPLLAWILVLLATWAVLCGDDRMLIPLVAGATFCAQTHVPYLPLGIGMVALGLGTVIWRIVHAEPRERDRPLRSVAWSVGVGAVLWLPPVADQLTETPGNLRQLAEHFGSPPEAAIGFAEGLRISLRHLDAFAGIGGQLLGTGRFVHESSVAGGVVTVVVWAASAIVAWRVGSRALRSLHVVVGVALLLGVVSTARIFGRPWFYLTLWAWGITAVLVLAVAWTALSAYRTLAADHGERPATIAGLGAIVVAVVVSLATSVAFADAEHPEERLSTAVGALSGPTYDAVVDGVGAATGPDGVYVVRWSDAADIGSPGFGLLDELERRGLDVAADEFFHVPVTEHRVRPRAEADAQIHLATGGYVEIWRAVPDAIEVATYDPRTDVQRAEYAEVRARFIE
ncbi:MAG: hypothetical protein ABWZ99_07040, partial [Ilumatobacteraceae bacterium]